MLGCFLAAFVGIVVAFFLVRCLRKDGTIKPRKRRKRKRMMVDKRSHSDEEVAENYTASRMTRSKSKSLS